MRSQPLPKGYVDVAGLRDFRVDVDRRPRVSAKLAAFLDSDVGTRVVSALIAFTAGALVMLAMDAVARAKGF